MPWFPTCGGIDTSDANVTPEDVLEGKIVYSHNGPIVGKIPSLPEKTWIPGPEEQVIPGGHYIAGTQTIKGDPNLYPENIVKGKTIFGVEGTGIPVEFNDPTFTTVATAAIEYNNQYPASMASDHEGNFVIVDDSMVIQRLDASNLNSVWSGQSYGIVHPTKNGFNKILDITPDDKYVLYLVKLLEGTTLSLKLLSTDDGSEIWTYDLPCSEYGSFYINSSNSTYDELYIVGGDSVDNLNTVYTWKVDSKDYSIEPTEITTKSYDYSMFAFTDTNDFFNSNGSIIIKSAEDNADGWTWTITEDNIIGQITDFVVTHDGEILFLLTDGSELFKINAYTHEIILFANSISGDYIFLDDIEEYVYIGNDFGISRYDMSLNECYDSNPLYSDPDYSKVSDIIHIDHCSEYLYAAQNGGKELVKLKQVFGSIYPLENPDPYINIDRIIKRKKDTYKTYDTPVEIWDDEYDSEIKSISCTDDGHYVYICTQNNGFIKMNSVSKKTIWTYDDGMSGYVLVDHNDQYVYVATNSALTKLDASNGDIVISLSDYARSITSAYSIQNMTITDDNEYLIYINNNNSTASSSKIVKFKTSDMSVEWEKTPHTNYINQLDLVSKTGELYFNKSSQIPIESKYLLPFAGGVNNVVYFNGKYLLLPNNSFVTNTETSENEITYYLGDTPNVTHMEKRTLSLENIPVTFSDNTVTRIVASSYICIVYIKGVGVVAEDETENNKYYYTYDGITWNEGSFGIYCPVSPIVSCNNTFVYASTDRSTYNKLFSSYDGITWNENTNYTNDYSNSVVWGLTYTNSRYILISSVLEYSSDFKTFNTATTLDSLPQADEYGQNLESRWGEINCVYLQNKYFLNCQSGIYYSTNLNTWTLIEFSNNDLYTYPLLLLTYSSYLYIISSLGDSDGIDMYTCSISSSTQTTFTLNKTSFPKLSSASDSDNVIYINNQLLAYPAVSPSNDELSLPYSVGSLNNNSKYINLTYQDTRTANNTQYHSSCYGNNKFVLLGRYNDKECTTGTDNYAYSTDSGATWTGAHMPVVGEWLSINYDNTNKFIAICRSGESMTFWNSTDAISWTQIADNADGSTSLTVTTDVMIDMLYDTDISGYRMSLYTKLGSDEKGYIVKSSGYETDDDFTKDSGVHLLVSAGDVVLAFKGRSADDSFPLLGYATDIRNAYFGNVVLFNYDETAGYGYPIYDIPTVYATSDNNTYIIYAKTGASLDSDGLYFKIDFSNNSVTPINVGLYPQCATTINNKIYGLNNITGFSKVTTDGTVKKIPDDIVRGDDPNTSNVYYTTMCNNGTQAVAAINDEPYAYYTKSPLVISGGDDKYIRATDFLTGNLIWSFSLSYAANGIYVSNDKKFVYATVNGNSSSAYLYKYNINATNLSQMKNTTNSYSSAIFGNGSKIFTVKSSNGGILAAYDPEYLTNDYSLTGANDTSTGQEYGRCLTYDSAGDYIYAGTYMNTGKGHLHKYKLKEIEYEKIARVYKTTSSDDSSSTTDDSSSETTES